jgi:hypothetical protein
VIKPLEILAEGPNVVMEYRCLDIGVMIFGKNNLLLGIGAAYPGTIAVAARHDLSGTDALNPGYFMGMPLIGRAQHFPFVRAGGTQQPFEVQAGYHVRHFPVAIVAPQLGIENLVARGEHDRRYVELDFLGLLMKIDCLVLTYAFANTAFFLFEVKAAFMYVSDKRNGLGKVYMNRFIRRQVLVVWIRHLDRTVLHTGVTPGAFVFDNVSGLFNQGDLEVS